MKSASTSGYQGIYTGMTRKEVEENLVNPMEMLIVQIILTKSMGT